MPHSSRQRSRRAPEQIQQIRRRHIWLLVVLVLLVYASALGGGFVWTDRTDILQGEHRLTALDDLSSALSHAREAYRARSSGVAADPAAGTWQPVTLLSNSISWGLWGDCAFCFRLENVLLHLLLVVGLYALGRHLLSQRPHGNRIAAWAAALFAAHPAGVTSVAWIGGRPYLLAALFAVWSLVIFTRLQATTKSRRGHGRPWLLALGLTSLTAMLAEETAYMLPLAALLIAAFESRERGRGSLAGIAPARWKGLALIFAALFLVLAYRKLALGGFSFTAAYPTESLFSNAGTALRHLWFFIGETLLPSEPIVSDAWRITYGWGALEVAALLGFILILAATLVGLRFGHPSALGVAWFLLWLIPGVGLFPSDHYHVSQALYIAAWGPAFALGYALVRLWRPIGRQLVPGSEGVILVPIILALGLITGLSNLRWWDHGALFESEIASDPHYIEGRLQLAELALERGEAPVALNHSLAAVEAARDDQYTGYWSARDAYYMLGLAQLQMDLEHDAVNSLATALEARPGDALVLYQLGLAQLSVQNYAAAESNLRAALQARQPFPEAEADLGVALADQQQFVDAYPLLADAVAQGLGNARRHRALALTMLDARQYRDAAEQLERSLALEENADERARLAWSLWQLGEADKARSHLNMAMLMDENASSPYVDWVREQMTTDRATPPETEN